MSGPIQGPLLSYETFTAFWGRGLFVFPLMLLYTVISYTVFRGNVRPTGGHY